MKAEDTDVMANIMSLCLQNGGVNEFGSRQADLTLFPASQDASVMCPDGTKKTRRERLGSLADIPQDDRAGEISAALTVAGIVGVNTLANFAGLHDVTFYTNTIVAFGLGVGILDNFYDVLALVAGQIKNDKIQLPEKGSMPLRLGTGQATGNVARGLSRMFTVDTERECQCEAAAFFAAYTLGLPCFAFRPNALEGADLVVASNQESSNIDTLASDIGFLKMLVWLFAPVAMESSKHPQLIMSDPRDSAGLLERLEDRAELLGDGAGEIFWLQSDQEKQDFMKWAYAEADLLVRQNRELVEELSRTLASGAATVGDCVAVIEGW